MKRLAVCLFASVPLLLAAPGLAKAEDGLYATSGSLVMTSESGDLAGHGGTYAFVTPSDSFRVWSYPWDPGAVVFYVNPGREDFWFFELAPPQGELLEAKTYTGATRASFRAPGAPGIDIRTVIGCTDMIGDFTVHEVEYGPTGVLTRLRATFEQHCGGSYDTPALRGDVDLVIPEVDRAPLELQLQINPTAKRSGGKVILTGTVHCNAAVPIEIQGFAGQWQLGGPRESFVTGSFVIDTECSDGATAFTAPLVGDGSHAHSSKPVSFLPGEMRLDAAVRADDPIFAFTAEAAQSLTLKLN